MYVPCMRKISFSLETPKLKYIIYYKVTILFLQKLFSYKLSGMMTS